MNDPIERQDAIDALAYFTEKSPTGRTAQEVVKSLPSAPPERKKGKWLISPDHREGICKDCNYKIYGRPYNNTYLIVPYNYCPNCGLPMEVAE